MSRKFKNLINEVNRRKIEERPLIDRLKKGIKKAGASVLIMSTLFGSSIGMGMKYSLKKHEVSPYVSLALSKGGWKGSFELTKEGVSKVLITRKLTTIRGVNVVGIGMRNTDVGNAGSVGLGIVKGFNTSLGKFTVKVVATTGESIKRHRVYPTGVGFSLSGSKGSVSFTALTPKGGKTAKNPILLGEIVFEIKKGIKGVIEAAKNLAIGIGSVKVGIGIKL